MLGKISREVQQIGTSLRMIPLRSTFQKMARVVRDISKKTNKKVDFSISGEDTELDKTVVDKINDPLVHILRNAMDHGVETPEERATTGKSEMTHIQLSATHKEGKIFIEIEDDGRGLDREKILEKARSRGIVSENETLSDREVWNLIFEAGLSTAKEVTDISGRGVGMDVVKRNIESLRGHIEITSEKGKGSIISIRLPLTLAIIEGMNVLIGDEQYIIPTASIILSMKPKPEDINTVTKRGEMHSFQGEFLPLIRLGEAFNINNGKKDPLDGIIVVVDHGGVRASLLIDEVVGKQQVVVKNLGDAMPDIPGVSGGAIMSDGNVALVLDVSNLVKIKGKVH